MLGLVRLVPKLLLIYKRLVQGHNGLANKVLRVLLELGRKRRKLGLKLHRPYKRLVPKGSNLASKHSLA